MRKDETELPDSPDVETVVLGPDGILEGSREGMIVIDMSTIAPRVSCRIPKRLLNEGWRSWMRRSVGG